MSRRPVHPLAPAAVFAAGLAASVLAHATAIDVTPWLRARVDEAAMGERPPGDDYYLASDIGGHVDHHVLYHGLDSAALAALRRADVVFLGNSRLMFGLRPGVMRPALAAHGLRYYALGFGFSEADRFPLALLEKFDVRPPLVVVNADAFFGGGLSAWAEIVHRDTVFAARKIRWEAEAAHEARRVVHTVLPHWGSVTGLPGIGLARAFTAYRSRLDGTWEVRPRPVGLTPMPAGALAPAPIGRGERAGALEAAERIAGWGTRLVLTAVPAPDPAVTGRARAIADLLDAPLVLAQPPGLATPDGSHLDAGSAVDWSRAFAEALVPYLPLASGDRGVR